VTARIAVLVPSRGRPWNVERLHSAIMDTALAPENVDVWLRLDHGDDELEGYTTSEVPVHRLIIDRRTRLGASWNELASAALASPRGYSHLALWGDDVVPETTGWDKILTERTERDGPGWVYGNDGVWDHTYGDPIAGQLVLPTATLVSREIVEALGWVSPAVLIHLCIDLAWRDLGLATNTLMYESGVMIRHLHRIMGAPDDATYREANEGANATHDHHSYHPWRLSEEFDAAAHRVAGVRERWLTAQAAQA
jgi:hypothetical protein